MDIMFVLSIAVALIMIAVGIYLFFFSRKSVDQAAAEAALLEVPDAVVEGRLPVVPRAARGLGAPAVDADTNADAISQYPDSSQADQESLAETEVDLFANIKPQQTREQPVAVDLAVTDGKAEPTLVATRDFVVEPNSQADTSLDSMLDDLDQATAKLIPPVERGEIAEWQGDSALLNAHLEDQARRDDDSPLAQAEQVVALYLVPTQGRSLEGVRVLSLLKQYGLRFGEMSLFHRFAESSGDGGLMFSVLRYTSEGPQGFDLETLAQEKLDGLAFFLALPNPEAVNGYDMMASISSLLARDFSAHLYDEEMNPFTKQLKAHYRHVVLEFKPKT